MDHSEQSTEKHLLDQLRMSMRVASERIAEAERKERAYVALIESMERKLRVAKARAANAQLVAWTVGVSSIVATVALYVAHWVMH